MQNSLFFLKRTGGDATKEYENTQVNIWKYEGTDLLSSTH